LQKIKSIPISESVFKQIRGLILSQRLKPGDKLIEGNLAEKLGVSRTPVREALHKLELEGLLKIYPRKYCEVIGITKESIHEINLIRVQLEPIVTRDAVKYLTEKEINYLGSMLELSEYYFKTMDVDNIVQTNDKFHSTIIHASHYKRIVKLLDNHHEYIATFRNSYMSREALVLRTIKEHRQIYDAILERNEEKAETAAKAHIEGILEYQDVVLDDM
jgi:DNA-binding GntR family transcriptional regulator